MRLDDPEISDEEVELELRLKYGFDQWKDDESEYMMMVRSRRS